MTAYGGTYVGCYVNLWNGNWRCDYDGPSRHTVLETSGEWD